MKRVLISLQVLGLCAFVVFGYLGQFHPAGDSAALLRLPAAFVLLVFAIALRGWLGIPAAGFAAIVLLTTSVQMIRPTGTGGDLVLYQKNMWWGNQSTEALATDIVDSGADVVTLQEVSKRNDILLLRLSDTHPHQHLCRASGWSGIAIASRHPIIDGTTQCSKRRGLALAQLRTPKGDVWVGSIHLPWPWPFDQRRHFATVQDRLQDLSGPVVIGGDFNMFSATPILNQTARLARSQVLGPSILSYTLKGLPIPIDHVIAPGGSVARRGKLGSDHDGILARISLPSEPRQVATATPDKP